MIRFTTPQGEVFDLIDNTLMEWRFNTEVPLRTDRFNDVVGWEIKGDVITITTTTNPFWWYFTSVKSVTSY